MTTTKRRSAVELFLFVVCFFAIWSVRATVLYAIDESIAPEGLRTAYSVSVKLILWVLPAFGYVLWVRHASPFRYLGLSVMPSAGKWLKYLVVIGLFLGAQVAFETVAGGKVPSLAGISVAITLPGVLSLVVAPFLEELLFRGLILHELVSPSAALDCQSADLAALCRHSPALLVVARRCEWAAPGQYGRRLHLQLVGRVALSGQLLHLAADPGAHCQQLRRGVIGRLI